MHELSIALEIISIVEEEMTRQRITALDSVAVRVGALSGVNPDALSFGFEAATADTALAGSRLVIETIPVRGKCRTCGHDFEVEEFVFICPACGSTDLAVERGEELEVAHLTGR